MDEDFKRHFVLKDRPDQWTIKGSSRESIVDKNNRYAEEENEKFISIKSSLGAKEILNRESSVETRINVLGDSLGRTFDSFLGEFTKRKEIVSSAVNTGLTNEKSEAESRIDAVREAIEGQQSQIDQKESGLADDNLPFPDEITPVPNEKYDNIVSEVRGMKKSLRQSFKNVMKECE